MINPLPATAPIRVFLVDDHSIFRAGLRAELGAAGNGVIDIIGEAGSVREATTQIADLTPDVVLLDVHMPDGGGLAIVQHCITAGYSTRFCAFPFPMQRKMSSRSSEQGHGVCY